MGAAEYPELRASGVQMLMGDRILVQWEEAKDEIKAGGVTLIRPDTHRKAHFTGEVLVVGPAVDADIQPGVRIVFDRFSNPEKFWDPERKCRLAIIRQNEQGSAFAIVPPRVKVGGGEGDFDYEN